MENRFHNHNGVKGILFTVNNVFRDQPENYLSQNINSIFGKTIFIDIQNKNKRFFLMDIGLHKLFTEEI